MGCPFLWITECLTWRFRGFDFSFLNGRGDGCIFVENSLIITVRNSPKAVNNPL